jgi:hypothetical protein
MAILLKGIYSLHATPSKSQWYYIHKNRKNNPKIPMEAQENPNTQSNPEQKRAIVL